LQIELRVKTIALRIDAVFKKVYRIDDDVALNYTCFFTEKKLVFKLTGGNLAFILPSLPESCLWDDTDLHININMMQSDLEENYNKMKKLKESEVDVPPTLWERIKSWF